MKTTFNMLLAVTGFIASTQAQAGDNYGKVCGKPASPLYAAADYNKPLDVQMIVNYKSLNDNNTERGVISVVTVSGQRETVPVILAPRGNSRRDYCQVLPLRMSFLDQSISKRLSAKLASEKLQDGTKAYMKRYLELLNKESIEVERDVKGQKNSLFEGLGDDVKIVTHCGATKGGFNHVGGLDEVKQNEKLMSEFYIYQILATLKMPVETARLAKIDYMNADGTPVYMKSRLAFFREPPTSVAKRCGLKNKPPQNGQYGSQDKVSAFQANFMNAFTANNDFGLHGHNMNNFYDENGKVFYGPYDFDLSGIFEPTYFKNQDTIESALSDFMLKLDGYDRAMVLETVDRTLAARSSIQSVITRANLSEARRAEFQKWFKLYFDGLEKYKNKKGAQ